MITISQVAKKAGVSVATVSRVMNKSSSVRPETVLKVQKVANELGYIPNFHVRNLRKNSTGTILVLLPNITNAYYVRIFAGLNEQAKEYGFNILLSNTSGRDQEKELYSAIKRKQADGAVLIAVSREEKWVDTFSQEFPIVQCCEYAHDCETPHISIDNYQATYQAIQYLVYLGHKKIGMISSTNHFNSTWDRELGYRDGLRDAGLPYSDSRMSYVDDGYSYESALKAAKQILSLPRDQLDAVFCVSDEVAFALMVVAMEMNIKIPQDLSVIGMDDTNYATILHPHITSVAQPCSLLGRRAIDMLMKLMRGEEPEDKYLVLPHDFVERESTISRI